MSVPRVFDQQHYELLNRARWEAVSPLLAELKPKLGLSTALDVGCGVGYFSQLLNESGFEVTAVDGRAESVEEAGKRVSGVRLHTANVEDVALRSLGKFDLVFCFGLLYHLENPFQTIRHLHAMTGSLLLAEGLIYPGDEPVMGLIDEPSSEDQGLRHVAFYPTESCLTKMMYQAGYACVYRFAVTADHPEYRDSGRRRKNRTMLAGSREHIVSRLLVEMVEPRNSIKPWIVNSNNRRNPIAKLRRFLKKPMLEKVAALKRLWTLP